MQLLVCRILDNNMVTRTTERLKNKIIGQCRARSYEHVFCRQWSGCLDGIKPRKRRPQLLRTHGVGIIKWFGEQI